jgi:predicted membrane protein
VIWNILLWFVYGLLYDFMSVAYTRAVAPAGNATLKVVFMWSVGITVLFGLVFRNMALDPISIPFMAAGCGAGAVLAVWWGRRHGK